VVSLYSLEMLMISQFQNGIACGDKNSVCPVGKISKSCFCIFYCNLLNSNVLYGSCGVTEKGRHQKQ
jgi:hypothetical protein